MWGKVKSEYALRIFLGCKKRLSAESASYKSVILNKIDVGTEGSSQYGQRTDMFPLTRIDKRRIAMTLVVITSKRIILHLFVICYSDELLARSASLSHSYCFHQNTYRARLLLHDAIKVNHTHARP